MLDEWRKSIVVPVYLNKGDIQSYNNYRGIKLMSHIMKLWERVIEQRLTLDKCIGKLIWVHVWTVDYENNLRTSATDGEIWREKKAFPYSLY
jgi:hypothetical protein